MSRTLLVLLASAALLGTTAPPAVAADHKPAALAVTTAARGRPTTALERRQVVNKLARELSQSFVFPDAAQRYAAALRTHLAHGDYDRLSDPKVFAEKVTADLQAVAPDGHLRLFFDGDGKAVQATRSGGDLKDLGLEETRMIGRVAYLRFSLLPDDPETGERARRFLIDHPEAQAVIIDSRPNHGGGLGVMDAILPLLYAQPTTLVRMDTRAAVGDFLGYKTLVRLPSPPTLIRKDHRVTPDPTERRLQHVLVFYLTSQKTASAAEHLALALKRTRRATLVGETTRGAGHYGGRQEMGARFSAFIPIGRTYDPDTGWDWEGKGVSPDVAVPADQALDKALELARAAGAKTD